MIGLVPGSFKQALRIAEDHLAENPDEEIFVRRGHKVLEVVNRKNRKNQRNQRNRRETRSATQDAHTVRGGETWGLPKARPAREYPKRSRRH